MPSYLSLMANSDTALLEFSYYSSVVSLDVCQHFFEMVKRSGFLDLLASSLLIRVVMVSDYRLDFLLVTEPLDSQKDAFSTVSY